LYQRSTAFLGKEPRFMFKETYSCAKLNKNAAFLGKEHRFMFKETCSCAKLKRSAAFLEGT